MAQRTGVMLAKPYTERLLAKMPDWVIVQAKLDGDRCRAIVEEGSYSLYSSQGTYRNFAVPHIGLALEECARALWGADSANWLAFDGELYVHGISHQQIRSVVSRTVNSHPDYAKIQFHVFDLIDDKAQLARAARLMTLAEFTQAKGPRFPIQVVPTFKIPRRPDEAIAAMASFLREGYEGAVIRNPYALYQARRSADLLKLKPCDYDSGRCLDLVEAVSLEGELKGMVGAFVVSAVIADEHKIFKVGAGKLTHHARAALWHEHEKRNIKPSDIKVHFRYLAVTDDGLPREPTCTHVEIH